MINIYIFIYLGGGGSWLGDPYVKPRVLKVSVMKSSSHSTTKKNNI